MRHRPQVGYLRWGGDGEAIQPEKGLKRSLSHPLRSTPLGLTLLFIGGRLCIAKDSLTREIITQIPYGFYYALIKLYIPNTKPPTTDTLAK